VSRQEDQLLQSTLEPPVEVSGSATPISRSRFRWWIFLLGVCIAGGIYESMHLKRGWVPHDEGAFAESAGRVLRGELPHRDYVEIYTGGLAYLHALSFRYLGEDFASPRVVIFAFFLAWMPAFYWLTSRLAPDWVAAGITLLAVAWSVPNYSAAVPSWYNLFFATFGMAALLRYLERRSSKWLLLAGVFGGLSILAKTTGIYYVAAALLFFVFLEQEEAPIADDSGRRSLAYSSFLLLCLLLFLAGLGVLIRPRASLAVGLQFVVPTAMLAMVVLLREVRCMRRASYQRLKTLLRMCSPFGLGVLIPLLVFLVPYIRSNAIHALVTGLFVLPYRRVQWAFSAPPGIATTVPTLCVTGTLALGTLLRGRTRWLLSLIAGFLAAYYLISSGDNLRSYQSSWHAAFWLIPFLAVAGSFLLRQTALEIHPLVDSLRQKQLFLIIAVMSVCGLMQYPFAVPIYFCYVAPLAILGTVAVLRMFRSIPRPLLAVLFAGFLLFAVFRLTPPFLYAMGFYYQPDPETQTLDLPRAGALRVDQESVDVYKKLIPLIQQHAGTGEIYAGPDCPQVYFLAGYKDPRRAPFQVFEEDSGRAEDALKFIDSRPIRVVVLNRRPDFSPPMFIRDVYVPLKQRFPREAFVGFFTVLWRD
jgi:hypothetical protein